MRHFLRFQAEWLKIQLESREFGKDILITGILDSEYIGKICAAYSRLVKNANQAEDVRDFASKRRNLCQAKEILPKSHKGAVPAYP